LMPLNFVDTVPKTDIGRAAHQPRMVRTGQRDTGCD
jgi:hypothetical protein